MLEKFTFYLKASWLGLAIFALKILKAKIKLYFKNLCKTEI